MHLSDGKYIICEVGGLRADANDCFVYGASGILFF